MQEKWAVEKKSVKRLRDGLGKGVDAGIIDAVIGLRLHGFITISSCEGHARRVTGGPYVVMESYEAAKCAALSREYIKTHPEKSKKYRKKANYHRAMELDKLLSLLSEFYAKREVSLQNRLIVQSMPMSMNILQCQGAESAWAKSMSERKELLTEGKAEMDAFVRFLKRKNIEC